MNPSDTVEVCEQNLSSFVQNKREVFDAMRAYQASELAHKTDAINFLKTILTVTVVLYGAILGALFSSEIVIEGKNWITFAILLGDCIAIFIVANATKKKITASHEVYEKLGNEYERFTRILQLNKHVVVDGERIEGKALNPGKPIGSGDGYLKSIHIIEEIGWAVGILSLALAVVLWSLSSVPSGG